MEKMRNRKNWATLSLDTSKRHLVFGDIHGRFETFISLLDKLNYDPATDLIYSVGDLIDRGPDSVSAVQFFMEPGCYAIRGNHEQFLVNPEEWYRVWMHPPNGGPNTIASLEQHGLTASWLKQYCDGTPIILDVGREDEDGAFRLIHAENPFGWSEDTLKYHMNNEDAGEGRLLWGRDGITSVHTNCDRLRPRMEGILVDVGRSQRMTFSGHTPTQKVVRATNQMWIDTYRSRTLTCVDAITHETHTTDCID